MSQNLIECKPFDGLVVDLFAGGGGASTGLAWALGRDPDIAINHDAEALAMHMANHPHTVHLQNDITRVLPLEATGGRRVSILHASPDCTHFSKAKGGKPRSQHIRDLAWVVVRWAEDTRPTLITLENVEEFLTWGPLDNMGQPLKAQAGETFRAWARRLRRLGYRVAWRLLRACDYGAPTTRKRLFVVARRDGGSITWPLPSHGNPSSLLVRSGHLLPWHTARGCINWRLPAKSIYRRKTPLAARTMARIDAGLRAFSGENAFLIKYYGNERGALSLDIPLHTITSKDRMGLVQRQGNDITLRMLAPRELYRAQGFPDSYIIDTKPDGRRLTKSAQVRMCGNSVPPALVDALVKANGPAVWLSKKRPYLPLLEGVA